MKAMIIMFGGLLLLSSQVWAGCLDATRLAGVNTAGAEFNAKDMPGEINKNYIYPDPAELKFISEQGATAIRLPIRWERIQREIKGPLDPAELKRVQQTVQTATTNKLCVIIDIHNYASYSGESLAGNTRLQDGFVDVWLKLAREFNNADTAAFDLMNEPSDMPIADWAALAKRTLAELRSANAKNLVFIAGGRWSGVHDWFTPQLGVSNADALANVKDPLNRTIIELHQYVDSDYSGRGADCRPPEKFDAMFQKVHAWATTNKQQLFLGEFGSSKASECLLTLEKLLTLMDDPVWRGWTYWATGRWWGDYPLALNTTHVGISAQWSVLKRYFHYPRSLKSAPNPPGKR